MGYKRLTKKREVDYETLFLENWFNSTVEGGSNVLHEDFELYSSFSDAQENLNAWQFCNYNDPGIGFPRECGPTMKTSFEWNSRNRTIPNTQYGETDYAFYWYTPDAPWTLLYGAGGMQYLDPQEFLWNTITPGTYIRRVCKSCTVDSHKDVYYKRLTEIAGMDMKDLFLSNWVDGNNVLGVDFNLFSSFSDAKSNKNKWTFCNYNERGIGFPLECGPTNKTSFEWNSLTRTGEGGETDYAFYFMSGGIEQIGEYYEFVGDSYYEEFYYEETSEGEIIRRSTRYVNGVPV